MVNAVPEPIILPVIFNDEFIVDAPETNKLVKFVLFNNDVDVAFKLLIDKVDDDDILFKFVFVAYTVKFGLFIIVEFQSDWKLFSSFPNNWISIKFNIVSFPANLLKVKPIYL